MILHLKPCLMWCMLFVGNINLTNMTELGDLTLVFLYYFDCVDPMQPRHILILDGPTMYATALMWVEHLFKFLLITPSFC